MGVLDANTQLANAASQNLQVTGNPTVSMGPTVMDLNKRSDRKLMRNYIRSQRDNGNIARGINSWAAVRNMRKAQNNGVQWDSTGHQVQQTQLSLPTMAVPQGLQQTWNNSQTGINKLNSLQSSAINNTINNLNTNFNNRIIQTSTTSNTTGTRSNRPVRTAAVTQPSVTQVSQSNSSSDGGASNGIYMSRPVENTQNLPAGSAAYPKGNTGPSLWGMIKSWFGGSGASGGTYMGRPIEEQLASRKNGGILKAQQGAQIQAKNSNTPTLDAIMNNPQLAEQFLSALSQQLGKEITLEDLTAAAANPEMGQQLEQLAQQMMKQSAKQGAKLEYISLLRGKCPEGQELVYFAKGGRICSACMGKKMEDGGEAGYMKSFRDRQKKKQMEKCGGKMKKGK